MKNILIISGHPDLEQDSVANQTIWIALQQGLPNATFNDLGRLYPDFQINVAAEQAKLVAADVIVLQYPVFWYHCPAVLQNWFEKVLLHGFSHGSTGDKLHGKKLLVSLTIGAPENCYTQEVFGLEIEDLFKPIKALCNLTGLKFSGSVHTCGVSYGFRTDENLKKEMIKQSQQHAEKLIGLIQSVT